MAGKPPWEIARERRQGTAYQPIAGPAREAPMVTPNQNALTGAQAAQQAAEARYAEEKARAEASKAGYEATTAGITATVGQQQQTRREALASNARRQLQNLMGRINAIDADVKDNSGWGETGWTGSALRDIPGTAAYDLAANIETLDASAAFKALQQMREESPTGGALGQITERELDLLKSTISNLNPNQSQESFLNNLNIARQTYGDMLSRLPGGEPGGQQQPQAPERADASTVFYGNPTQSNQREVATGGSRLEPNPALAGLNAHINGMLKKGASSRDVMRYLQERGVKGAALIDIGQQVVKAAKWRDENPSYKGDFKLNLELWDVPNSLLERSTPEAAYFGNAANALTLGNLDTISGDPEQTRLGLEGLRQQNPNASLAGTVTGGALAAGGGEMLAGRLGLTGGRAALAGDALFGGGYGAGQADDGNRLMGAVKGAGLGLAGGIGGRAAVSGGGRALTGVRDEAVRELTARGIPMTVGQIAARGGVVGKGIKKIEDALMSVPILGAAIQARRAEGAQGFNAAAFREAGAPINAPAGGIAEEGVESGRFAVSGAYSDALSGVQVAADKTFIRDMTRAMAAGQRLHPKVAKDFKLIINNEVGRELASGRLTGEGYQALRQALRQERAVWKGKPRGHQYGQALRQVEGALESLVRRRAPGVVDGLNRADRAYGMGKVVEDAVGRGANTGGVFTPAQLGLAARKSGNKYGGTGATTARPFFDLQRAGQDILPSQVPNSGTADRLMGAGLVPALAGAGAAGQQAGLIDPSTAAVMVAMGLPFTKAGQATFQRLLVQRPELVRAVGQKVLARKGAGGLFGAGAGVSLTGE